LSTFIGIKTNTNNLMISKSLKAAVLCSIVCFTSCKNDKNPEKEMAVIEYDNILLQEWTGPYDGVPAFDKMNHNAIKEAMETGMELSLKDIDAIVNTSEDPTFENTIAALEASGKKLNDVFTYYGILSSNIKMKNYFNALKSFMMLLKIVH